MRWGAVLVPAAQLDAAALFGSIFLEPNRLQPQSRNTVRMNPHWTRTSLPASAPSLYRGQSFQSQSRSGNSSPATADRAAERNAGPARFGSGTQTFTRSHSSGHTSA